MSRRWRFVAGVRCPACGALDTLRMRREDGGRSERECVDCGFHDVQGADDVLESPGPSAGGRLGPPGLLEPGERVVRIVAPDRGNDA